MVMVLIAATAIVLLLFEPVSVLALSDSVAVQSKFNIVAGLLFRPIMLLGILIGALLAFSRTKSIISYFAVAYFFTLLGMASVHVSQVPETQKTIYVVTSMVSAWIAMLVSFFTNWMFRNAGRMKRIASLRALRSDGPSKRNKAVQAAIELIGDKKFVFRHLGLLFLSVDQILEYVTLGAKLYPGSDDKASFTATTDHKTLASCIKKNVLGPGELQISVGFDTEKGIYRDRAKYIALALWIASTDLKNFQALDHAPPRDKGASYGLVIRGDRVESLNPINFPRTRLDYIFQVSEEIEEPDLARLIAIIRDLNMGLLLSTALRSFQRGRARVSPKIPLENCAIIYGYEAFERNLVRLLRKYDRLKEPDRIYKVPGQNSEDRVRFRVLQEHHLEEALYPDQKWVHDLYEDSVPGWNRLLRKLRGIEGVMLHLEADEDEVPIGIQFINEVRELLFESATSIHDIVEGRADLSKYPDVLPPEQDPFVDPEDPEQSERYTGKMSGLVLNKDVSRKSLLMPEMLKPKMARRKRVNGGI